MDVSAMKRLITKLSPKTAFGNMLQPDQKRVDLEIHTYLARALTGITGSVSKEIKGGLI